MHRIKSAIKSLKQAELRVKELKKEINTVVEQVLKEGCSIEMISDIYWNCPEVSVKVLCEGAGVTSALMLLRVLKPLEVCKCEGCGVGLFAHSRTEQTSFKPTKYGYHNKYLCVDCRDKKSEARDRRYEEEERQEKERLQELKYMPYQEYLKTPEWQETRKRQLRRSDYRCQVCNEGDKILDVHHRTYENKGCEYYSDLIVLCRDCHSTFHFNKK